MSKQANTTVIGGFVVGALVLAVAGIVIFGSGNYFSEKNRYVLFFDGSVQGLNVGSAVVFRGVKVGSVKDIHITTSTGNIHFSIPVLIEIEDRRFVVKGEKDSALSLQKQLDLLIDKGLRAQLEMQSMVTGQLIVNLDFHPGMPAKPLKKTTEHPEIPTIPSEIEELTEKIKTVPVEQIFNKLLSIITRLENALGSAQTGKIIDSLGETIARTNSLIHHLDQRIAPLSRSLEASMAGVEKLSKSAEEEIVQAGKGMDNTMEAMEKLAAAANQEVGTLAAAAEQAINDVRMLAEAIKGEVLPLSVSIQAAAGASASAAHKAEETLGTMNSLAGRDSELVTKLAGTLEELSQAARSFRLLTDYLERHPDALIKGKR
ncbi:MAG TPA: MlaD family protein [Desulfobacteraceae bacterium]|nr:MlaD family protein [Desulfobacteraceae bacterium]